MDENRVGAATGVWTKVVVETVVEAKGTGETYGRKVAAEMKVVSSPVCREGVDRVEGIVWCS